MLTPNPFDDILKVIEQVSGQEDTASRKAGNTSSALGAGVEKNTLSGVAEWFNSTQQSPQINNIEAHICVFASSYSDTPSQPEVTEFMQAAQSGNANVNKLCTVHGVGLRVLELAPGEPHSVLEGWSELECTQTAAFGMEAAAAGGHILGISAVAPGNRLHVLALLNQLLTADSSVWREIAKLLDQSELQTVATLVAEKTKSISKDVPNALHYMRHYCGREVAATVGAILAARGRRLAVVGEGWAFLAACFVLQSLDARSLEHCVVGAAQSELEARCFDLLGVTRLQHTIVDSGPGCSAAIGISVIEMARLVEERA
jgi:nicotinate-nucleotide--dimethylbenzimidazole phosphoribosyltransferase